MTTELETIRNMADAALDGAKKLRERLHGPIPATGNKTTEMPPGSLVGLRALVTAIHELLSETVQVQQAVLGEL